MLLVDGKPYDLTAEELKEYNQRMIWHVPPKPFDQRNSRHGIGAGIAFPNSYTKIMLNGKRHIITYYTREEYDDSKKKPVYLVDNTGNLIMIGDKGILDTKNPELNWFLENCPWNAGNKLRATDANPYRNDPILFMRYNPQDSYKVAEHRMRARRDLWEILSAEAEKPWTDTEVVMAAKTVTTLADRPIPQAVVDWKEYANEPGVPALRNALLDLGEREPLWLKSTIVTSKRSILAKMIHQCLENTEVTGFTFNAVERKFYTQNAKGAQELFLEVPEKKDPERYLIDVLWSNNKMTDRLAKLHDKIGASTLV